MKHLRLKILLLLITILIVTSVFTLIQNTKTIDFVPIKNRSTSLEMILDIQDVETRKAEGEKFLNQLNEKYSKDQQSNARIFSLVCSIVFICLLCIIIISIELFLRR